MLLVLMLIFPHFWLSLLTHVYPLPDQMILLVLLLISPLLTLTLTHVYLLPDQMILLVWLLIFPTLDFHSNSFVSTVWPNNFTSLTVNLPHSWLSL
jgi:hypothetical protein